MFGCCTYQWQMENTTATAIVVVVVVGVEAMRTKFEGEE
jgi:hypothetical protein